MRSETYLNSISPSSGGKLEWLRSFPAVATATFRRTSIHDRSLHLVVFFQCACNLHPVVFKAAIIGTAATARAAASSTSGAASLFVALGATLLGFVVETFSLSNLCCRVAKDNGQVDELNEFDDARNVLKDSEGCDSSSECL